MYIEKSLIIIVFLLYFNFNFIYNKYMNKNIIVIAGPTCVGKTKISIELSKIIDAEIVSCDSMQIYKKLNIGTAKIKESEKNGIIHYMIDEIEPTVDFNIKKFKELAHKYIYQIFNKNKTPILVGGTGFYLNSILYDNDFPEEDENIKNKIIEELDCNIKKFGIEFLYDELKKIDNVSYKKIDKNNIYRLKRAYVFYKLHNKPISTHNEIEKNKKPIFNGQYIFLNDDRENLYKNINNRVEQMFDDGLIDEVTDLIKMGVKKNMHSMSAIGYKELYDYCYNTLHNKKNDDDIENIKDKIKQHSRNYAKRQITWFHSKKIFDEYNLKIFNYDYKKIVKKILEK